MISAVDERRFCSILHVGISGAEKGLAPRGVFLRL